MHKQSAFALTLLFSFNIFSQEGPGNPDSSKEHYSSLYELQRESFEAVRFSKDLKPLSKKFCKDVIAHAPIDARDEIKDILDQASQGSFFSNYLIFHGPTGSGKSTLGHVIAQETGLPFMIVNGSMLANEYANSASAGLKRIGILARKIRAIIVMDEMDSVTKKKNKRNKYQSDDETSKVFWELLGNIKSDSLLFIGTTNDLKGMPLALQDRLKTYLYEIPYLNEQSAITNIIETSLNGRLVADAQKSIKKLSRILIGIPTRDIDAIVSLAYRYARNKNRQSPIIVFADFEAALQKLKADEKLLSKSEWDKKEISIIVFKLFLH